MKEYYDFNSQMFGYFLNNSTDKKISFSQVTNWHSSHPYYRLNYYNNIQKHGVACFGPKIHQNGKRGLDSGCHGPPELK